VKQNIAAFAFLNHGYADTIIAGVDAKDFHELIITETTPETLRSRGWVCLRPTFLSALERLMRL
jgi:hypothetical protein